MSTYTVTLYDRDYSDLDEYGRRHTADGRWTHPHGDVTREDYEKARAKIESAYRGPWCPDCGKKGNKCEGRAAKGCKSRALKNAVRGLKAFGHTLPVPPDEWRAARGYSVLIGARFYHKTNTFDRQMRQHYAYELAIGHAEINLTAAA